jgi:hypothetical protein
MSALTTRRVAACLIALALTVAAAPPATSLAQTHVAGSQTHV